jgi:hypothetical protein
VGFVIGAIVGTLAGSAVLALLSANKHTVVMCDWDNCKHCSEDGFCTSGAYLRVVEDEWLECVNFEWREGGD